jgi:hypothetical protein
MQRHGGDAPAQPAQHLNLRRVAWLAAYSVSCALLHNLLQHHYFATCRASWLSFLLSDPGPYCTLVRRGLSALQWSPLVASGIWIQQVPQDLILALTGRAGLGV